jgi:hypothetical protein
MKKRGRRKMQYYKLIMRMTPIDMAYVEFMRQHMHERNVTTTHVIRTALQRAVMLDPSVRPEELQAFLDSHLTGEEKFDGEFRVSSLGQLVQGQRDEIDSEETLATVDEGSIDSSDVFH